MASTISINGRTYHGNNVTVTNGVVIIDGKRADAGDEKEITISITGNVDSLKVDACQEIEISGNVGSINVTSGDITCGDVTGSIQTVSGDVDADSIGGSVNSMSGDIKHRTRR